MCKSMELLRSAAEEARSLYESVANSDISIEGDLATITKRVADTEDLDMFLCMGPHIKDILRYTDVVSGIDFLRNFRRCVHKLEDRLGEEEWYAVTNHGAIPARRWETWMEEDGHKLYRAGDPTQCKDKSGMFFLLLALSYSDKLMASLRGIVCTPTQFSMDCSHVDKKLVMFDDMSYTGLQAGHTLGQFREGNVIFVCPYIGTAATVELRKVDVISERTIRTLRERLYSTDEGRMGSKCSYKLDAYPIWFHHKMADNISSFPEIYQSSIDKKIVPPYKNTSEFPNYSELVMKLSREFVFECNRLKV